MMFDVTKSGPENHYPYRGVVTWLRPEEGGRLSGPPQPSLGGDRDFYAATARYPGAETIHSYVLRGFEENAWESAAEGRWLIPAAPDLPTLMVGTMLDITEGPKLVAHFVVTGVPGEKPVPAASRRARRGGSD